MEYWLVLGLFAAVSYSLAGLAAKSSMSGGGLNVSQAGLAAAAGVLMAFLAFAAYQGMPSFAQASPKKLFLGVAVGVLWALGQILVYLALVRGADISRMAPIYNLNTLFVVVLGVLLLGELPDKAQALRVGFGALLITAGAVLVSI